MDMAVAEIQPRKDIHTVSARAPDVVRWAAVIAGVVIGLGFFALLNTLWWAIRYSTAANWVSDNLAWLLGGSAAVSLLLAGLIAGAIAGVRGTLAGLVNGATAWGLLFLLSVTTIIPGAVNLTSRLNAGVEQGATAFGGYPGAGGEFTFTVAWTMWTSFWSLLVGLVLAAIGGIIGGRLRRPMIVSDEYISSADSPAKQPSAHETGNGEWHTHEGPAPSYHPRRN
jgi:hypothetical protein